MIEIFFGFLFEWLLLTKTLPAGDPVVQIALCGVFLVVCVYVCTQRSWRIKALGKGPALLLQILFSAITVMTSLNALDYFSALGAFAVVPANLALIATCLVGSVAHPPMG